jgi:EAL domain-containing protein (putative c-di-GMP-specific phosphodiesterase class I)
MTSGPLPAYAEAWCERRRWGAVMPPRAMSTVLVAAFNTVLSARAIRSVYQPVVALADGEVVGFEALARGPSGTVWTNPDALVSHADRVGRLPELDWICRAAAVRGALDAGLSPDMPLFVNIEPASARTRCPPDLAPVIDAGAAGLEIVAELTERSLAVDPAGLLRVVEQLRRDALRIALDDVGADPSSQALMPLLEPDVIKLDRTLVQHPHSPHAKVVLAAVAQQAERTGAVILAEGIETPENLAEARAMGATLGQGWLLGCPGPLPKGTGAVPPPLPMLRVDEADTSAPFAIAREHVSPVRVDEPTLASAVRRVEEVAERADQPSVLFVTLPGTQAFDAPTQARYVALAARRVLAAVYAAGMPTDPGPNLRGCPLDPDDPLAGEAGVLVISAQVSAAAFAVEVPGAGPRHFDMIETRNPDLIIAAARPLVRRLIGSRAG